MTNENRGLYCINMKRYERELEIYGSYKQGDFNYIEMLLLPCNYVHFQFGSVGDTIDE